MNPVIAKMKVELSDIDDRLRALNVRRNQLTTALATYEEFAGQIENTAFLPKKPNESNKSAIIAALLDILSDGVRRRIPELLTLLASRGLTMHTQKPENTLSVMMSTDGRFEPSRRDGWTLTTANSKPTEEAQDAAE